MRKMTKKYKSVSRFLSPIALALILAGCETNNLLPATSTEIMASANESSQYYLINAESSAGKVQIDWYLLALEALINEKDFKKADRVISLLAKKPMSHLQLSEWQLDRANLEALKGNYKVAVEQLNFQPSWKLPPPQFLRYYRLKTKLYRDIGNIPAAVLSASQANHFITNNEELQDNNQFIWQSLNGMTTKQLKALSNHANLALLKWIGLVEQLRLNGNNPVKRQNLLDEWKLANPESFASISSLETNEDMPSEIFIKPSRIGVLLPLTGKFAAQGEAIRNGILKGYMDDQYNLEKPSLQFYNTHQLSMETIISKLQADGIQYVIGPLQKHKVSEYLDLSQRSYPTLAMNIIDSDKSEANTCFFTLSPEQEAEQAARHISEKAFKLPLVIAPNNSLGKRASQAFIDEWTKTTGRPVERAFFKNTANMQRTIQKAFGITESNTRSANMKKLIGADLKSEQRSRRDIDSVYLIANSDELTLLKPFIEVTINPNAPLPKLFASSRGNNRIRGMGEIGELRGIEFTDIPLITHKNTQKARAFYQEWPDLSNGTTRLYALGLDAYSLIEALPEMQTQADFQLEGYSGVLSMGNHCIINRTLPWVVFGEKDLVLAN